MAGVPEPGISTMPRLIPPAGVRIPHGKLKAAVESCLGGASARHDARQRIDDELPGDHKFTVSSGRAALCLILRAIGGMQGNSKDAVVIPAYTCYSVAASIARAGYRIQPVDIDPKTLDYDYDSLESSDLSNTLAIVGCNLFGIVSDFKRLRGLSERHDIRIIDDAAQSLGSTCDGRQSGTCGDAGFYSLDRGKNITTFSGGVIVTDDTEIAEAVRIRWDELRKRGSFEEFKIALKLSVYRAMIDPRRYWYLTKIPFLGLGLTIYDESFEIEKLTDLQTVLLSDMILELDRINSVRARNAHMLIDRLNSLDLLIPGSSSKPLPFYLRLPIIMPDRETREEAVRRLRRNGITATSMYPRKISDIPGIGPKLAESQTEFPGADTVVERLLTLPTHEFVTSADIQTIVITLKEVV